MNTRAQFDVHPDAESLNAFAEQALEDREREEILAHLAACRRCRDVVFLAQEAAGLEVRKKREEELAPAAPAPVAAVPMERRQRESLRSRAPWYRSWWMTSVPVGALAVIVALATLIQVRHVEQSSEMAKNAQPAPMQTEGRELPPPSAPEMHAGAGEPKPEQRTSAAGGERQGMAKGSGESRAGGIAGPVVPESAAHTANGPMVGGSGGALGGPRARSQALARGEEKKAVSGADSSEEQERSASVEPASPPSAAARPGASETVAVRAQDEVVSPSAQAIPEPAGSLKASRGIAASTYAMYRARPTVLPSGLPSVSTATVEHSVLGVDRTGDVFLSEDSGAHWQTIARQWDGRAVAVRMVEAGKKDEADGKEKSPAKFELVNDEGKVWVSSDGRTWTVK